MAIHPPQAAIEAIASLALTAMSTIVAIAALLVAYRQNVGWKPAILVSTSRFESAGGMRRQRIAVVVEFWNRQRYPVAIRSVLARVSGVELEDQTVRNEDSLSVRGNAVFIRRETVVAPQDHEQIKIYGEFRDQSLDAMTPLFDIKLSYFDPMRNKTRSMRIKHRFFYPDMGWKKSAAERARIRSEYKASRAAEDAAFQQGGS